VRFARKDSAHRAQGGLSEPPLTQSIQTTLRGSRHALDGHKLSVRIARELTVNVFSATPQNMDITPILMLALLHRRP